MFGAGRAARELVELAQRSVLTPDELIEITTHQDNERVFISSKQTGTTDMSHKYSAFCKKCGTKLYGYVCMKCGEENWD